MESIYAELDLLKEYLAYYIQIVANKTNKYERMSFEYFKENYDKVTTPNYADVIRVNNDNKLYKCPCKGISEYSNHIAERKYNYWKFNKVYTEGNIQGEYTTVSLFNINKIL